MPAFPLSLGRLDHYTLIVRDVAASTRFHMDVLGFGWVREQKVNAGSAPEGEYDMLNHILHLPGDPSRVVVITEGLTEDSIFRQYLDAHGPGVHHVAYTVDNLEGAFTALRDSGVAMTSERIVHDPLSGLRQVFLGREETGYFIELIERTEAAEEGTFKEGSMAQLANTMKAYVGGGGTGDATPDEVQMEWPVEAEQVLAVLSDPARLPAWTAHQTLMRTADGHWVERRLAGDVPLEVAPDEQGVTYTWHTAGAPFSIRFHVASISGGTGVRVPIPPGLGPERAQRTASVIAAELRLLAGELGLQVEAQEQEAARQEVARFHLEVYARPGA